MKRNKRAVPGIVAIAILLVITMIMNVMLNNFGATLSGYMGGGASVSIENGDLDLDEMSLLAEGREVDRAMEAEGAVLLRNENNALPLEKGSKVTILGAQSYNYVNGGTGSAGGKYDEYTYTMKEAFEGNKEDGSESASKEAYLDVNDKAWDWLEKAVGGERNANTTEGYYGHLGDGTTAPFEGSEYKENKDNYGNGDWGGFKRVCEFAKDVYEDYRHFLFACSRIKS